MVQSNRLSKESVKPPFLKAFKLGYTKPTWSVLSQAKYMGPVMFWFIFVPNPLIYQTALDGSALTGE